METHDLPVLTPRTREALQEAEDFWKLSPAERNKILARWQAQEQQPVRRAVADVDGKTTRRKKTTRAKVTPRRTQTVSSKARTRSTSTKTTIIGSNDSSTSSAATPAWIGMREQARSEVSHQDLIEPLLPL